MKRNQSFKPDAIAGTSVDIEDGLHNMIMRKHGKLPETVGRKATGTKALHAKSAWPLINKSKPPEMAGRKVMGTKAGNAKSARPLII